MSRKKILIIIGVVIGLAAAGGAVFLGRGQETEETKGDKKEAQSLVLDEHSKVVEQSDSSEGDVSTGSVSERSESAAVYADEETQSIPFPCVFEESKLTIQKVQSYSGSFVEDGTNTEMEGIAAILVTNTGDDCIEYGNVYMTSQGTELVFTFSLLEAGESCVVLEEKATAYTGNGIQSCDIQVVPLSEREMAEGKVKVAETKNGDLTVKNISGETIPAIRIFYKNYSEADQVYIGGIAYNAKVTGLEAGYTQLVTPTHYIPGQSKILMIRTYETEE